MSLENLPQVQFCETDAQTIENSIITIYEKLTDTTLFPGDPVRLFLEALAAVVIQQRTLIDQTGKQNLLKYATGDFLDNLGALTDTPRLAAAAAVVTMRFSIAEALGYVVAVPAGTRVTPDGKLMFETTALGEIGAGDLFIDVSAACQVAGSAGNGLLPGQISKLVDPVSHVTAVANTTATEGGADVEGDDEYRDRIYRSIERHAAAGSRGQYEFWAKTAHQDIADVAVISSEPGVVDVYPLLSGGRIPGQDILDLVVAALDPDTVVPLTDTCRVQVPELVPCRVEITWFLSAADSALAGTVQTAVASAVDKYAAWQVATLGRDINPTELIHLVRGAGACRVAVVQPAYQALGAWQAADIQSVEVGYGGLES